MSYRSIYAYPWDVAARGVGAFVDEALERGLNGVTLAAAYHAGKFLRPQAARVVFPEDGVTYFEPSRAYGALKPVPHSDPALRRVFAELARDGRLAVHAWTVLLHNTRLGSLHPACTVRNAFGDGYVYSLCPSHAEVFGYALTLALDAGAQGVQSLVLETPGWLPYAHGYHHEFAQLRSNVWLDTMLGLCFCDACKARARIVGIDGAALQARIAGRLRDYLQAPVDAQGTQADAWLAADLLEDTELSAYVRMRQSRVTELVAAIRAALPREVALSVIPTTQRPTAQSWIEGSDLAALASVADFIEVPFYEPDAARVLADAFDTLRRVGCSDAASRVRAILRPGPPDLGDGAQLPQAVAGLAAQGIRDFAFYNYGLLRSANLDAMGHVLRAHIKEHA